MVRLLQVIQSEGEGCRSGNRVRRSGRRRSALIGLGPASLCPCAHPSPVGVREGACTATRRGALRVWGGVPGARTPAERSGGGGEESLLRLLGGSGSGKTTCF